MAELEDAVSHWVMTRTRCLSMLDQKIDIDFRTPEFDLGEAEDRLMKAALKNPDLKRNWEAIVYDPKRWEKLNG